MSDTDMRKQIGKNVRYYRKKRGITQAELAMSVGFRSGTPISLLESGQRNMLADVALRISRALDVTVTQLIERSKEQKGGKSE